jgi:hypothetical protein
MRMAPVRQRALSPGVWTYLADDPRVVQVEVGDRRFMPA